MGIIGYFSQNNEVAQTEVWNGIFRSILENDLSGLPCTVQITFNFTSECEGLALSV